MPEITNINVKVPSDIKVSATILRSARAAAQAVIDSQIKFAKLSADLKAQGIIISAEELAKKADGNEVGKGRFAPAAKRTRTRLSDAQRKEITTALKGGATASSQAKIFGCSIATVNNIKSAAGLVKKKVAKKAAKKRK